MDQTGREADDMRWCSGNQGHKTNTSSKATLETNTNKTPLSAKAAVAKEHAGRREKQRQEMQSGALQSLDSPN